ncbi:MAG TPA: tetratricopeptide repeat protein [Kofleriaceae bacterium]|jgi:predicted Zn-dependent protease
MAGPPKHDPPYGPAKPNKKQVEIEKHEWMAEYYVMKANDLDGAAKEYKAILGIDPSNEHATLALASIYMRGGKAKLAVEVVVKLTKKTPKSPDAWLSLAELQAQAKDEKGMKASLDRVIAIDPANEHAYQLAFMHAEDRVHGGDDSAKPEALDAAKKLKQLTQPDSYMRKLAERAVVELSGDPMELTIFDAKASYSAAFDGDGYIADINDKMSKARAGFQECTRSQPKNEECHYYLGLVYSSVKASEQYDPKKAIAEFQGAPGMPLAWVEQAKLDRASDKNEDARTALGKALALDKNLAAAHVELGILDKLDGKTDSAVTHLTAAIDADPYGPIGDRALSELSKVDPKNPYVLQGMMAGKSSGDIFSSDRYQAVIPLLEQQLGGVDEGAPEKAVVEDIVHRLADASNVHITFKVAIVKTEMVNAMALADGRVYVTRGLIDMLKKKFPKRAIDANNDILGHILGHELSHVIRRHTVNSAVFQEAFKDTTHPLDPSVLTSMTRLQEMDADRQGMVMAFLAGYHPRGGIEFMEVMGQEQEIPPHLDHPTFQERVEYLTDYWTNDVRYAFVSFKLGVAAMDKGGKLESTDMTAAIKSYEAAVEDFKRYRTMLPSLKEAMNDLGIAYAKLGVLAMADSSPLGRWQTRFSLERDSAVKYKGLARDESEGVSRGAPGGAVRLPWQLRESISQFKEAIGVDEGYAKARLNLATAYLAANQLDNAKDTLAKADAKGGVAAGDIELIRGIVLAESRDFAGAKAAFDKAIGSQTSKRAASFNLARALELSGDRANAKRAYQQYSKLFPGGPWAAAADEAAKKL